jgi:hypothetical protein
MERWHYLVVATPFLVVFVLSGLGYHRTKNVLLLLAAIFCAAVAVFFLWLGVPWD